MLFPPEHPFKLHLHFFCIRFGLCKLDTWQDSLLGLGSLHGLYVLHAWDRDEHTLTRAHTLHISFVGLGGFQQLSPKKLSMPTLEK